MKRDRIIVMIVLLVITIISFGCKKQNNEVNENGDNAEVKVTTYAPQAITENTVVCGGDAIVLQQGLSLSQIGICWSMNENPTINDQCLSSSNWQSPFVCTLRGLESGTTYYYRAYALRGLIVYYGEEKMFSTLSSPVVKSIEVNEITQTSAIGIGEVVSEGSNSVIERGFCWNMMGFPTINDNHINNGSGVGLFNAVISGLSLGTTYHARAYAINEVGVSYGSEIVFTTVSDKPSISVIEEEGFVRNGDTLEFGAEYRFGFFATSNVVTQADLASLSISIGEENWKNIDLYGLTSYSYTDTLMFSLKGIIGEKTITAVVTDLDGNSNEALINVSINLNSHPLVANAMEWTIQNGYSNGFDEQGLYLAGIFNGCAQIMPLEGVSLFVFDSGDWSNIFTDADKILYFMNAIHDCIPQSVYNIISVEETSVYDELIGTIAPDGSCQLIHITRCSVSSGEGSNFISIVGETK